MSSSAKKRREASDEINRLWPAATSCSDVTTKISSIRARLVEDNKHAAGGDETAGYRVAYENNRLNDFLAYQKNNCTIPPASPTTSIGDAVLDSALVPDTGISSSSEPFIKPASASSQQTTVTDPLATAPAKQIIKGVPNWTLYVAGGLLALIVIIVIVKKKPATN